MVCSYNSAITSRWFSRLTTAVCFLTTTLNDEQHELWSFACGLTGELQFRSLRLRRRGPVGEGRRPHRRDARDGAAAGVQHLCSRHRGVPPGGRGQAGVRPDQAEGCGAKEDEAAPGFRVHEVGGTEDSEAKGGAQQDN